MSASHSATVNQNSQTYGQSPTCKSMYPSSSVANLEYLTLLLEIPLDTTLRAGIFLSCPGQLVWNVSVRQKSSTTAALSTLQTLPETLTDGHCGRGVGYNTRSGAKPLFCRKNGLREEIRVQCCCFTRNFRVFAYVYVVLRITHACTEAIGYF